MLLTQITFRNSWMQNDVYSLKVNGISNVKSNMDTSQQEGEGGVFSEFNISNPYQTGPIEKNNEKIHLGKITLEEKLNDLKEKKTGQKGNIAFGSGIGNVKIVSEKEDELNPKLTKEQQAKQAKYDALLDELNAINAKIIAEEAKKKNVEATLANKKALFPPWSLERVEDEPIESPKLYWLEPQTSFSIENDLECQMDLHSHEVDEFSLADLPLMNPFDWISILNIISNEPAMYEPICSHMKRLIKAYIVEISKMDVEISSDES
ncbi:unnamed protein product [Lactuca virosa]|uniref:Uncharacterized protein n=1 Tax=Lactuca virosa TaxID=75947 RepID=A0AAU9M281_9ASTR|nr:unnamed protein product [Lactuca virosa]